MDNSWLFSVLSNPLQLNNLLRREVSLSISTWWLNAPLPWYWSYSKILSEVTFWLLDIIALSFTPGLFLRDARLWCGVSKWLLKLKVPIELLWPLPMDAFSKFSLFHFLSKLFVIGYTDLSIAISFPSIKSMSDRCDFLSWLSSSCTLWYSP